MALATGAQAEIGYIEEVTYGVTPATPELVALPVTGITPEVTKEGFQSGDLRADRQISDFRHGGKATTLALPVEMKHTEFDALLESALFGAWATDVLKAGVTKKSFTMEVGYTDIAQYHAFTGLIVNSFSLSVSTDATVTGTFNFVGQDMTPAGATIDNAGGLTPVGANRSFDSFSGVINEGGSAIAIVTAVEISIENGLTPAKVIGSDIPQEYFDGRCNVTGTISAFFEDAVLLNKFLNETPSDLDFTLTDPDANTLQFEIPRIIYTGGSAPVSGEAGIVIALPFQAIYDVTEDTALKITRS